MQIALPSPALLRRILILAVLALIALLLLAHPAFAQAPVSTTAP
jgi:hypothetical protein